MEEGDTEAFGRGCAADVAPPGGSRLPWQSPEPPTHRAGIRVGSPGVLLGRGRNGSHFLQMKRLAGGKGPI